MHQCNFHYWVCVHALCIHGACVGYVCVWRLCVRVCVHVSCVPVRSATRSSTILPPLPLPHAVPTPRCPYPTFSPFFDPNPCSPSRLRFSFTVHCLFSSSTRDEFDYFVTSVMTSVKINVVKLIAQDADLYMSTFTPESGLAIYN